MTKEELKEYRKSLGLTQAQFARWTGLKREKTIADYETGRESVPDWLVSRIELEIDKGVTKEYVINILSLAEKIKNKSQYT